MSSLPRCERCGRGKRRPKTADGEFDRRRPRVLPPELADDVQWRYAGVRTQQEAETLVDPTGFRLYHFWDAQQSVAPIDLPLTVVYRDSDGRCHHWLVRSIRPPDNHDTKLFYVEKNGPSFATLTDLCRKYDNYSYINHGTVDVFWIDDKVN